MSTKVVTFLILCFTSAAFAEDFKTVNGKEYKDATVTRVDPDGVVVKAKSGITKVYFIELPKEVQERFHYDSERPRHILPSRPPITPNIKSSRTNAHQQQAADAKSKAALSNNKPPQIARRPCKPASRASETGR
jgi:hypothetical protein